MLTIADKRAAFRKLHESGCFIIPNPFDVGSAVALQHLGFKALASTSAGFAWTLGKPDNRVTVDDVCTHLAAICADRGWPYRGWSTFEDIGPVVLDLLDQGVPVPRSHPFICGPEVWPSELTEPRWDRPPAPRP